MADRDSALPTQVIYVQEYPVVVSMRCPGRGNCCKRMCAAVGSPGRIRPDFRNILFWPHICTPFIRRISWTVCVMPRSGWVTTFLFCRIHGALVRLLVRDDRLRNSWSEQPSSRFNDDEDAFCLRQLFGYSDDDEDFFALRRLFGYNLQ